MGKLDSRYGTAKVIKQGSKAHLIVEADVQGESVCVSKINLVSQGLTDFSRSGGWVYIQTDSAVVHQRHRHLYGLLGLRGLSAGRRKVRQDSNQESDPTVWNFRAECCELCCSTNKWNVIQGVYLQLLPTGQLFPFTIGVYTLQARSAICSITIRPFADEILQILWNRVEVNQIYCRIRNSSAIFSCKTDSNLNIMNNISADSNTLGHDLIKWLYVV